jgi:hypothetical protein
MSALWRGGAAMNATIDDQSLRDTAEAGAAFRERTSAAEIARRLEVPTSTVIRRDERHESLLDWDGRSLLRLGRSDALLGEAMVAYLRQGAPMAGAADSSLGAHLAAEIDGAAEVQRVALASLSDGRWDAQELARLRAAVLRQTDAAAMLLRSIEAKVQEVRRGM